MGFNFPKCEILVFQNWSKVKFSLLVIAMNKNLHNLVAWDSLKGMFRNEALHTIFVFFLLQDCIEAIAATAFVTSEYPVILSFENHCNQRNQEKMAKYCDSIFGDLLCNKEMKDFPVSSIVYTSWMISQIINIHIIVEERCPNASTKQTPQKNSH